MIQLPPAVVVRPAEKTPVLTVHVTKDCDFYDSDMESTSSDDSYAEDSEIDGSDARDDPKGDQKQGVTGRKSRVAAWSRRAMRSLRNWFTLCLGEQDTGDVWSQYDDYQKPLLFSAPMYTPRHAATSFLRTATPRKMRDANRCL
ncbi:hypothetical protein HJFPF1_01735 [Paramyrothecium foliicola]|nr:hypothetical protein HJFPF1_01735 [Paramyrothecium foliicola]